MVLEEYRQRVESNAQGKLKAEALSAAFKAHPYRNPSGGWPSDIPNLRRTEAQAFFERYYVPGNITVAIVGDVTRSRSEAAGRALLRPHGSQTDASLGDHRGTAAGRPKDRGNGDARDRPSAVVGYKRPSQYDKDDIALDLIQILLSQGRTGLPLQRAGSGEASRPTGAGDCDRTRTAAMPTCLSFCWCRRRVTRWRKTSGRSKSCCSGSRPPRSIRNYWRGPRHRGGRISFAG